MFLYICLCICICICICFQEGSFGSSENLREYEGALGLLGYLSHLKIPGLSLKDSKIVATDSPPLQ